MRFYLDSEFIEDGHTIDLISIGIVAEDGREYYALNAYCDHTKADGWVKENVLKLLPLQPVKDAGMSPDAYQKMKSQGWRSPEVIAAEVAVFMGATFDEVDYLDPRSGSGMSLKDGSEQPEIWADYGSYDWVVLCQLWGKMIDLPNGFPMYINDIQQERRRLGGVELPKQVGSLHNALEDARYVKSCVEHLDAVVMAGEIKRLIQEQ